MSLSITCPRCGEDFDGSDRQAVASAVMQHAKEDHGHRLDLDVVLAHLDGVHPSTGEQL